MSYIKYFVEGLIIGGILYILSQGRLSVKEIFLIALIICIVNLFMDMYLDYEYFDVEVIDNNDTNMNLIENNDNDDVSTELITMDDNNDNDNDECDGYPSFPKKY